MVSPPSVGKEKKDEHSSIMRTKWLLEILNIKKRTSIMISHMFSN